MAGMCDEAGDCPLNPSWDGSSWKLRRLWDFVYGLFSDDIRWNPYRSFLCVFGVPIIFTEDFNTPFVVVHEKVMSCEKNNYYIKRSDIRIIRYTILRLRERL